LIFEVARTFPFMNKTTEWGEAIASEQIPSIYTIQMVDSIAVDTMPHFALSCIAWGDDISANRAKLTAAVSTSMFEMN
jgi:prophage DNA circulation protein